MVVSREGRGAMFVRVKPSGRYKYLQFVENSVFFALSVGWTDSPNPANWKR
jgi:hypothetical protein